MRLVESKPEPEHARPLAPAGDDLFTVRALEIEVPKDAELARVQARRFDRLSVDGLAEGAWRVDHRAIDTGGGHLGERVVDRIRRNLPVMGAHLGVAPDVDLGIDYQHACSGLAERTTAPRALSGFLRGGGMFRQECFYPRLRCFERRSFLPLGDVFDVGQQLGYLVGYRARMRFVVAREEQ